MNTKLLRQKILDLAIRGKLTEQKKSDGTTKDLLKQIAANVILSNAKNPGKSKNTPKEIIPLDKSEAPFEIPENWEWVRLPDICSIPITDGTHQTPTYSTKEDGVPFLSSKDVAAQKIAWERIKYITKDLHEELYKRIAPRRNDILLAKNGTTGVAALVETDVVFDIYVTLAVIRPYSQIYPKYLLWVINSPVAKKQFDESLKGTGVPNLHLLEINKTMIPLPPLAEQQRIVTAIENAFAEITEIENNQELLKKHIKQGRQKILDLAIRGKLTQQLKTDGTTKDLLKQISSNVILSNAKNPAETVKSSRVILSKRSASKDLAKEIIPLDKTTAPFEIPSTWEWVKLRDIGEYRKGPFGSALTKSMFVPKGLNTVKVYEQKNAIRKSETLGDYYITREYFESSMRNFEVFPGDIIVSCAGTIGETFILPDGCEQGIINQALMRMKITPSVNLDYFLYYFDSVLKSQSGEEGKGTAIKNIPPFAIFKEYPFPLPPLAEQQRIVATIEQAFAEFDAMESNL